MGSSTDHPIRSTSAAASSPLLWDMVIAELMGLDLIRDATQVAKLSQDYYHFSPILQAQLAQKVGDVVVRPVSEAEVIQVVKTCVRHQVPLTVRGAGTGNYGQAVPLAGGVVLDLSRLTAIEWIRPGLARVQPGVRLAALDKQAKPLGWELRMAPSTYRTATIGGFIGGGSCGMGSINFGMLSDRGNLHGVRVVTMEAEPRILELTGDAVQQVNHAYGTTGIMTALEVPLAPAYDWAECIVGFSGFMEAARFGQALSDADGIVKKLVSVFDWPIPSFFAPLQGSLVVGEAIAIVMVADSNLEALRALVADCGGVFRYEKSAEEASRGTMLLEYTWNHTTLHARSSDPSWTYLQTILPRDPSLQLVEHLQQHFGDEVLMHLEFLRRGGVAVPGALQLVRFTTAERLNEIIEYLESKGAFVANPHVYTLEDGGSKQIDPVKLAFKKQSDPMGLLNPGKMRGWTA
jgi:FAD/FMN-containing dehydrogenase